MAVELYLPKMSDHMEEAVFLEWLVQEGDAVEKGQPVLAVETDKVTADVESPASGWIKNMRAGLVEGVAIAVGETIAFIVEDADESVPVLEPVGSTPLQTPSVETVEVAQPQPQAAQAGAPQAGDTAPSQTRAGAVAATPIARRVARELGIDLADVAGTGPGGRVSDTDVRRHAAESGGT